MADISPREPHSQTPAPRADGPLRSSNAAIVDGGVAERRCGRCLQMFPGDATRAPTTRSEWWLCEPCERILLGHDAGAVMSTFPRSALGRGDRAVAHASGNPDLGGR